MGSCKFMHKDEYNSYSRLWIDVGPTFINLEFFSGSTAISKDIFTFWGVQHKFAHFVPGPTFLFTADYCMFSPKFPGPLFICYPMSIFQSQELTAAFSRGF